jgi:hypothetical protein
MRFRHGGDIGLDHVKCPGRLAVLRSIDCDRRRVTVEQRVGQVKAADAEILYGHASRWFTTRHALRHG